MTPTIAQIQAAVCEHYGLHPSVMRSRSRYRADARPRQVAMYLSRLLTRNSLPQIGSKFSRDHTTVIHAIDAVNTLTANDCDFTADLCSIHRKITGSDLAVDGSLADNSGRGA